MENNQELEKELEEAVEMVNKLSVEDEIAMEHVELERLLSATENVTFNEMVGIE